MMTTTRFYPYQATAIKTVSADVPGAEVWTCTNKNGTLLAYGWRSEKQLKHDFYHHFGTEEARDRFIDDWFANQVRIAASKTERKEKRRAQNDVVNPVNLGDVFVNSWGYDQTNIDFYQVVGLTPRGVKLREIASASVSGPTGDLTDRVVAAKDRFKDEVTITKRLYFHDGKPYVSMDHGSCSLWDGKPEYESSYH